MVICRSAQTLALRTPMTLRKPGGLNVTSVEEVVVRAAARLRPTLILRMTLWRKSCPISPLHSPTPVRSHFLIVSGHRPRHLLGAEVLSLGGNPFRVWLFFWRLRTSVVVFRWT